VRELLIVVAAFVAVYAYSRLALRKTDAFSANVEALLLGLAAALMVAAGIACFKGLDWAQYHVKYI
jgi:hypothetical protein